LPKLDTTPPVTKTYFAVIAATSLFDFEIGRTGWAQSSMAELQTGWKVEIRDGNFGAGKQNKAKL
jgi:hypothetical protein